MSQSKKREIAKQFDLPERKSKIATLFKQNDEVYCICQSTDATRFMICCDSCEEWFHGDCVQITEAGSKNIKHYFCPPCMEKNPELEIEYKKPKPKGQKIQPAPKKSKKAAPVKPARKTGASKGRGGSSGAGIDTKLKEAEQIKLDSKSNSDGSVLKQVNKGDREVGKASRRSRGGARGAKGKGTRGRKKPATRRKNQAKKEPVQPESSESEEEIEVPKQCYGKGCLKEARPDSKYCSEDCGIQLATDRIYRILPLRLQEWSLSPSHAEQKNKSDLEEVRKNQQCCRDEISALDQKRAVIDRHIQNVQQLRVDPKEMDVDEEEDGLIYCVTCGHEISTKTCIKHMEKCYNKYESQTSFGSMYPTRIEGAPIFCDFYNPATGSYCKRLQVLCPEHTKEAKVSETEICGCPMDDNIAMAFPSGRICRVGKKKCNRHFGWERVRRGEIDMERVRVWLRLDELVEQERQLRLALTNRAGAMALLLHSTFDHDLRLRLKKQIEDEEMRQCITVSSPVKRLHMEARDEVGEISPLRPVCDVPHEQVPDMNYNEDEILPENIVSKNRGHKSSKKLNEQKEEKKSELTASQLYKQMKKKAQQLSTSVT